MPRRVLLIWFALQAVEFARINHAARAECFAGRTQLGIEHVILIHFIKCARLQDHEQLTRLPPGHACRVKPPGLADGVFQGRRFDLPHHLTGKYIGTGEMTTGGFNLGC